MKRFSRFFKQSFSNLLKAYVNIIIFLPYFFSVKQLLKTLFDPWKNIVFTKKTPGFSISESFELFFANTISRIIGFISRISLISFYFMLNILLIIIFPIIILIYFLLLPINFLAYFFQKSEEEKKEIFKKNFFENHLINEENRSAVDEWFEEYYQKYIFKTKWWELKNLFQNPPLGRHLSLGYTNFLENYAEELTDPSYLNNRLPVYDREEELKEIELALSRSMEPNVVLVGEEGVGKHAVIDSLATRIFLGHCHPQLAYRRIFRLNMEKILAQSDDYQKKINLLEEIFNQSIEAKNIILVIDNFENYCSPQGGKIDLSLTIEKYAKRNDLQFIGITEPFSYQKIIYPNDKINQLFSKITINEIDSDTARKILLNLAFNFENQYQVFIPYEVIKLIIDKTQYFITDIPFPEKSLVLLDEICVYAKRKNLKKIFPAHVDEVLTKKTHIPTTLTDEIKKRLLSLEKILFEKIIGQDYAIKQVAESLKKSFILYTQRKKPLGSFLFLGPTGVGKTETAKALADIFFGSEKYLIRIDMSLYQSKNDIPKLIGDINTGNPGLLTKSIREHPFGVLLLDELEKADRNLINIFLTIIDEAYFYDGFGKKVDCKNLIIIATSNAGSEYLFKLINEQGELGDQETLQTIMNNYLIVNKIFSPEFLNRFDGVIVYQPLTQSVIKKIVQKKIEKISDELLHTYQIKIEVSEAFIDRLIKEGYRADFGARQMERVIREKLENHLADLILNSKVKIGDTVNIN